MRRKHILIAAILLVLLLAFLPAILQSNGLSKLSDSDRAAAQNALDLANLEIFDNPIERALILKKKVVEVSGSSSCRAVTIKAISYFGITEALERHDCNGAERL